RHGSSPAAGVDETDRARKRRADCTWPRGVTTRTGRRVPTRGVVEVGGPERWALQDFVRAGLDFTGDVRRVEADPGGALLRRDLDGRHAPARPRGSVGDDALPGVAAGEPAACPLTPRPMRER